MNTYNLYFRSLPYLETNKKLNAEVKTRFSIEEVRDLLNRADPIYRAEIVAGDDKSISLAPWPVEIPGKFFDEIALDDAVYIIENS